MIGEAKIVSIAEFAHSMGISRDSAKRWIAGPLRQFAKIAKTKGGHWRVELPAGDFSSAYCRWSLAFRHFFHRKRKAKHTMPMASGFNLSDDNDTPEDVQGLPFSVDGMFNWITKQDPDEAEKGIWEKDPGEIDKFLSFYLVWHAAFQVQKMDGKVTVAAIAEALHTSVPSLYRKPFGRLTVRAAISKAINIEASAKSEVDSKALMRLPAGSFGISKKRDSRKYIDRRPGKSRRTEKLREHLLFWRVCRYDDGLVGAALWITRGSSIKPLRTDFSPFELSIKLATGDKPSDAEPIGNVLPSENGGEGYSWQSTYGGRGGGQTTTFAEGVDRLLVHVSNGEPGRKIVILNPRRGEVLFVPMPDV
jgi:hypothetical protein